MFVRWMTLALFSSISCLLPLRSLAQPPSNSIGIFFDAAGTQTAATPPPFTVDNFFWALGFDLGSSYRGYEFAVSILDPNIIVLDRVLPAGAFDTDGFLNDDNWIVALTECTTGSGVQTLVVYQYAFFVPVLSDALLCVDGAVPSRFDPAVPGYEACDGSLVPFVPAVRDTYYPDGCSVLWPTDPGCDLPSNVFRLEPVSTVADPGQLVPVPVQLSAPEGGCPELPLPGVLGVDFTLEWDPAVATLEGVDFLAPAADWTNTADIQVGSVAVTMQAGTPVGSTRDPMGWVSLQFRASQTGGTTVLHFVDGDVQGTDFPEIVILEDASLTVRPVATADVTFGALKSRF